MSTTVIGDLPPPVDGAGIVTALTGETFPIGDGTGSAACELLQATERAKSDVASFWRDRWSAS